MTLKGLYLSFLIYLFSINYALAVMPTNPVSDPHFTTLPSGKKLSDFKIKRRSLSLTTGAGANFTQSHIAAYQGLKAATKNGQNTKVRWAFMDLDTKTIIDQSNNAATKIFGASVSKIFVAATLLHREEGKISDTITKKMANMLVVSSNSAWKQLQTWIGDGSAHKGRQRIHEFTQSMGYQLTRGFSGWLGNLHGNELTATELTDFLHDTYMGKYLGAETLWKLMHTCRTGYSKALKYLPRDLYVGGKTGTYTGATFDPKTGSDKNPDGTPYKVSVRNHVIVFHIDGRQYGLAVLANNGSNESVALLAGGLFDEYVRPLQMSISD